MGIKCGIVDKVTICNVGWHPAKVSIHVLACNGQQASKWGCCARQRITHIHMPRDILRETTRSFIISNWESCIVCHCSTMSYNKWAWPIFSLKLTKAKAVSTELWYFKLSWSLWCWHPISYFGWATSHPAPCQGTIEKRMESGSNKVIGSSFWSRLSQSTLAIWGVSQQTEDLFFFPSLSFTVPSNK